MFYCRGRPFAWAFLLDKETLMKRLLFVGMLVALALGVGLWLGNRPRQPTPYEIERTSMSIQVARTMLPFRIAFRVLLGLVALFTLGGLGWGAVRWLNRRADTVYPDRAGLYPIREGRVGRAKVFHDPNRTLAGTTVYASGDQAISVNHPLPQGRVDVQQQVTSQAQATQALRAAVSGPAPLPSGQALPLDLLDGQRMARPLPEVKDLDLEPMHIERLLLQDGNDSA
jgi:hypothetical protein